MIPSQTLLISRKRHPPPADPSSWHLPLLPTVHRTIFTIFRITDPQSVPYKCLHKCFGLTCIFLICFIKNSVLSNILLFLSSGQGIFLYKFPCTHSYHIRQLDLAQQHYLGKQYFKIKCKESIGLTGGWHYLQNFSTYKVCHTDQ